MEYNSDEEILDALAEKFDDHLLKERKGFIYIPEPLVRDRLINVLGFNWDWVILKDELIPFNQETETLTRYTKDRDPRERLQVVVHGALTLYLPSGKVARRDAFGGSPLINGSMAGDSYKAAASNAFKKAAYLFNVGGYLGMDALDGVDDTKQMKTRQAIVNKPIYQKQAPRAAKKRPFIPGLS